MSGTLLSDVLFRLTDSNGDIVSGGSAEFYLSGTSTLTNIYSEGGLTTLLPNPISTNAAGLFVDGSGNVASVYLNTEVVTYKMVIKDAQGATIRTIDPLLIGSSGSDTTSAAQLLINAGFRINQRQTASNADDTYCLDRWYVLTQSNAIAASQQTNPEADAAYGIRLTQSNASAQRMGLAQIVEGVDSKPLRGSTVTFQGRVGLAAAANVKIAILEWTGTEDSVTSDVVLSWTSTTYTANNFFLAANLTVAGVGTVALDHNIADFSLTASISSSIKNLIVFAWTESTCAQNVTLDFNRLKAAVAPARTTWSDRLFAQELLLCQRFYEKSFALGTAPAQNAGSTGAVTFCQAVAASTGASLGWLAYQTRKRAAATVTLYNPAAANAQIRGAAADWSTSVSGLNGTAGFELQGTSPGGSFAGQIAFVHYSAECEL